MLETKHNLKILLIAVVLFLALPTKSAFAASSQIGDTGCKNTVTNDDCEIGGGDLDCERSNLPNSQTFCTCWSDSDCKDKYGGTTDGGDWKCVNDLPDLSHNLHYCKSSLGQKGTGKFVVAPSLDAYCLGSTAGSTQLTCEPSVKNFSCDNYPALIYLPVNFKATQSAPFNTLQECNDKITSVATSVFCNVKNVCIPKPANYPQAVGCVGTNEFKDFQTCQENASKLQSCSSSQDCNHTGTTDTWQYCADNKCYYRNNLLITSQECQKDSDCQNSGSSGLCFTPNETDPPTVQKYCFYATTKTTMAETIKCGTQDCFKSTKTCPSGLDSECNFFTYTGICKDKVCWYTSDVMKEFTNQSSLFGITADLTITKPVLEIKIPQLTFSDVSNTLYTADDGTQYITIPYVGEFLSAIYKFGMAIVSIIAVIMIIVEGAKITVMGGEQTITGLKKIGQIIIGLFIAWGSYAILYNINPDLVNFKMLKVQYIVKQDIEFEDEAPNFGTSQPLSSSGPPSNTGDGAVITRLLGPLPSQYGQCTKEAANYTAQKLNDSNICVFQNHCAYTASNVLEYIGCTKIYSGSAYWLAAALDNSGWVTQTLNGNMKNIPIGLLLMKGHVGISLGDGYQFQSGGFQIAQLNKDTGKNCYKNRSDFMSNQSSCDFCSIIQEEAPKATKATSGSNQAWKKSKATGTFWEQKEWQFVIVPPSLAAGISPSPKVNCTVDAGGVKRTISLSQNLCNYLSSPDSAKSSTQTKQ